MVFMLIGGERVGSVSGKTYEVCNPATGELVDTVPLGTAKDVEQAIDAAEQAFSTWAEVSAEDRGVALANACELIKEHAAEIAQLLTAEQGKTLFEANLEVHHLVHGLEFYAGLASKVRGSYVPLPQKGAYGLVVRQPIGVCGAIVPWNFPLTLMGTKLGPALAAGNTIIIKPASTTPLATLRTAELIQQATYAGGKGKLPAGAVNVVTGPGAEVGEELLRNPHVRRIAFTGSTEVGRHVMQVAGKEIKRVTLELGGSDPMIVCADADIDMAAKMADTGRFFNCGQMCLGVKRLFVHDSVYDTFVSRLKGILEKKTVGPGTRSIWHISARRSKNRWRTHAVAARKFRSVAHDRTVKPLRAATSICPRSSRTRHGTRKSSLKRFLAQCYRSFASATSTRQSTKPTIPSTALARRSGLGTWSAPTKRSTSSRLAMSGSTRSITATTSYRSAASKPLDLVASTGPRRSITTSSRRASSSPASLNGRKCASPVSPTPNIWRL